MKYAIVTTAKDEEKFISQTIDSIISQTIKPQRWIILNDDSSDLTEEIIREYSKKNKWIELINISTQDTERKGGAKVARAINTGLKKLNLDEYEYIVKLDADLMLPRDYFELIHDSFEKESKLGLCGGFCVNLINGKKIREKSASYHVRGAFKSYRTQCLKEIGGVKEVWNWDGIDEMIAMYKGWTTKTLEIPVIHFRPTSSSYNNINHAYESGKEAYRTRSNLFLTFIRAIIKFKDKPYLLTSVGYIAGYISAFVKKEKRYVDKELGKFINKFHFYRIFESLKIYEYKK